MDCNLFILKRPAKLKKKRFNLVPIIFYIKIIYQLIVDNFHITQHMPSRLNMIKFFVRLPANYRHSVCCSNKQTISSLTESLKDKTFFFQLLLKNSPKCDAFNCVSVKQIFIIRSWNDLFAFKVINIDSTIVSTSCQKKLKWMKLNALHRRCSRFLKFNNLLATSYIPDYNWSWQNNKTNVLFENSI